MPEKKSGNFRLQSRGRSSKDNRAIGKPDESLDDRLDAIFGKHVKKSEVKIDEKQSEDKRE